MAFKGPLPSTPRNHYLLTIVDEYSCIRFAFPCPNMTMKMVIRCLNQLFAVFRMPAYVHFDRGHSFLFKELRDYLTTLGIAASKTTSHNPRGMDSVNATMTLSRKTSHCP